MSSWKELLTLYLRPAREYQELFLQTFFFFLYGRRYCGNQEGMEKKFFSLQQINVRKLLQSSGYLRFKIKCLGKIPMDDFLGAILSTLRFLNNEFPLMSSLQY
uniref:PRO1068 n=1 Tax=Homo sapiens TaxID=9606 RepID=Q9P1K8_HUMAN|nr:PRO1068 [Homo sapiens]